MKPLQVPHWGSYGESCPFPEPSFGCLLDFPIKVLLTEKSHPSFKVPGKGASPPGIPHRAPTDRERERERERLCFQSPPSACKVSGKWAPLQVLQWSPYVVMPISRAFFYTSPDKNKISPFSQSPQQRSCHSMFPKWDPYREGSSVSTASGWLIHLYFSDSPVKEPSHEIEGNHMVIICRMAQMHKYGESKMAWIMMETVHHVVSWVGCTKFQAAWFLLHRVYICAYICKYTYMHKHGHTRS